MKILRIILFVLLGISFTGLILKLIHLPGANYFFAVALSSLCWAFMIQIILIAANKETNKNQTFTLIGAFMSLTMAIGYFSLMGKYLFWAMNLQFIIASVFFAAGSIGIILLRKKMITPENKKIFIGNLLIPWIIFLILALPVYVLSPEQFYNAFCGKREQMNYQQFQEWQMKMSKTKDDAINSTNDKH